jgi:hypothetical protein
VVSFTPLPLYPLERAPGTHFIGVCMKFETGIVVTLIEFHFLIRSIILNNKEEDLRNIPPLLRKLLRTQTNWCHKFCAMYRSIAKLTKTFISYSFSMAFPVHSGPRPLIQFRNHFSQKVGLLGRVISPSQGRYLHTGHHKHRINAYTHQTFVS